MNTTNVHHHRPQGIPWTRFHERVRRAHRRAREALEPLVVRQGPRAGSVGLELGTDPQRHRTEQDRAPAWMLALELRLGDVRVVAALARVSR